MTKTFDFTLLSRYRSELMGISILGIMLAHISGWVDVENTVWLKAVTLFSRLSHTEGFLLLCGGGLYFSLSKALYLQIDVKSRRVINDYYMRRFCRLGVPFVTISFPFYLSQVCNLGMERKSGERTRGLDTIFRGS